MIETLLAAMLFLGGGMGLYGYYVFRRERMALKAEFDRRLAARTKLVRAAAHELRQPLNSIAGLVSSVRATARATGTVRVDVAEKIDQSINDLNDALLNTLEIFDLSDDDIHLDPHPIDLRTEVKLLIRKRNKSLARVGSQVKAVGGHLPELWVEADPVRVRQCISVLLDQALSQTHEGTVRISYRVEKLDGAQHRIRFTVKDNGAGMDQHRADRYFDPANYEDNPALRGRPAAMLALNLAARVAELMGGSLSAKSKLGAGTTFQFVLVAESCPPNDEEVPEPMARAIPSIPNPSFENLSVLLVDDNEMNLFVLQEFIMPLHFGRVVCAADGKEAIERAQKEAFDLILLDIAMPEIDGFAVAKAVRDDGLSQAAPIIAVSAEHLRSDDPRLVEAGIDAFVPKPVVNADLFAAILKVTPEMISSAMTRGINVSEGQDVDRPRLASRH